MVVPTGRRSIDAGMRNETGPGGGAVRRSNFGGSPNDIDDTNVRQHDSGYA